MPATARVPTKPTNALQARERTGEFRFVVVAVTEDIERLRPHICRAGHLSHLFSTSI